MKTLTKNLKKEILKNPTAFNVDMITRTYFLDDEIAEIFKEKIDWREKFDTTLLTENFFVKNKVFFDEKYEWGYIFRFDNVSEEKIKEMLNLDKYGHSGAFHIVKRNDISEEFLIYLLGYFKTHHDIFCNRKEFKNGFIMQNRKLLDWNALTNYHYFNKEGFKLFFSGDFIFDYEDMMINEKNRNTYYNLINIDKSYVIENINTLNLNKDKATFLLLKESWPIYILETLFKFSSKQNYRSWNKKSLEHFYKNNEEELDVIGLMYSNQITLENFKVIHKINPQIAQKVLSVFKLERFESYFEYSRTAVDYLENPENFKITKFCKQELNIFYLTKLNIKKICGW
jgi:hypothetical protein